MVASSWRRTRSKSSTQHSRNAQPGPHEAPPYAQLVAAWKELRAVHAVSVREIACVGAPRTLLAAEIAGAADMPAILLSAGVHGDERAAPWALLSLVRDGLLDRRYAYRIWPCTNPTGYELGTRENAEGVDVNRSFGRGGTTPEARAIVTATRDRRYELALDLHEDFEAAGFYCYEPSVAASGSLGPAVIAALDAESVAVQTLHDSFDLGYAPEQHVLRSLERGRVVSDTAAETRAYRDSLPFSLFVLRRTARRVLTFESPRQRSWDERIAAHRIAVVAALECLQRLSRKAGAA